MGEIILTVTSFNGFKCELRGKLGENFRNVNLIGSFTRLTRRQS